MHVLIRSVVIRPVVIRPVLIRPVVIRPVVIRPVVIRPVVIRPVVIRPVVIRPVMICLSLIVNDTSVYITHGSGDNIMVIATDRRRGHVGDTCSSYYRANVTVDVR